MRANSILKKDGRFYVIQDFNHDTGTVILIDCENMNFLQCDEARRHTSWIYAKDRIRKTIFTSRLKEYQVVDEW